MPEKMVFIQGPTDEIWIDHYGQKYPVGVMTEAHAKNALRAILREKREAEELNKLEAKAEADIDIWPEGCDNYGSLEP